MNRILVAVFIPIILGVMAVLPTGQGDPPILGPVPAPPSVTCFPKPPPAPAAQESGPDALFSRTFLRLQQRCPTPMPVLVVVEPLADKPYWGVTVQRDGVFEVHVAAEAPDPLRTEILTHEWAHCMTWDLQRGGEVHGQGWGVAYSRCYLTALDGAGH